MSHWFSGKVQLWWRYRELLVAFTAPHYYTSRFIPGENPRSNYCTGLHISSVIDFTDALPDWRIGTEAVRTWRELRIWTAVEDSTVNMARRHRQRAVITSCPARGTYREPFAFSLGWLRCCDSGSLSAHCRIALVIRAVAVTSSSQAQLNLVEFPGVWCFYWYVDASRASGKLMLLSYDVMWFKSIVLETSLIFSTAFLMICFEIGMRSVLTKYTFKKKCWNTPVMSELVCSEMWGWWWLMMQGLSWVCNTRVLWVVFRWSLEYLHWC